MLSKAMLGPWRSNGEHLILIPGRRGTCWFSAWLGRISPTGSIFDRKFTQFMSDSSKGVDRFRWVKIEGWEAKRILWIQRFINQFFGSPGQPWPRPWRSLACRWSGGTGILGAYPKQRCFHSKVGDFPLKGRCYTELSILAGCFPK